MWAANDQHRMIWRITVGYLCAKRLLLLPSMISAQLLLHNHIFTDYKTLLNSTCHLSIPRKGKGQLGIYKVPKSYYANYNDQHWHSTLLDSASVLSVGEYCTSRRFVDEADDIEGYTKEREIIYTPRANPEQILYYRGLFPSESRGGLGGWKQWQCWSPYSYYTGCCGNLGHNCILKI